MYYKQVKQEGLAFKSIKNAKKSMIKTKGGKGKLKAKGYING